MDSSSSNSSKIGFPPPNILDYEATVASFRFTCPEYYNFGFDVVDVWTNQDPSKIALISVSHDGESSSQYTFREMKERSNRMANIFRKYGITRGERLLVFIGRQPEWYDVTLATIKLGIISIPTTVLASPKEIEVYFRFSFLHFLNKIKNSIA